MIKNDVKKILLVYVLWLIGGALTAGVLDYKYLEQIGASLFDLLLMSIYEVATPIVIILALRKIEIKKFMYLGLLSRVAAFIVLMFATSPGLGYIYFAFFGLPSVLFWLTFNKLYFKENGKNNAFKSSVYYGAIPLIGIIIPAVGGIVASVFGFDILFLLSIIFYTITFISIKYMVKEHTIITDVAAELKKMKGLRTLILLEGFFTISLLVILPLLTIKYFEKPDELGFFTATTGILAIISSLIVSKLSDKKGHRKKYIWIFACAFGILMLISSISKNSLEWFFYVSLINVAKTMFMPFTLTIIMDKEKKPSEIMMGREFLLSIGRVTGVLCTLLIYYFYNLETSLIVLGSAILLYPVILEWKKLRIL